MATIDESKQKAGKTQNIVMNTTNNSLSDMNNIYVENKNKIPRKIFIIMGIVIVLIFILILVMVIVLANKKGTKTIYC